MTRRIRSISRTVVLWVLVSLLSAPVLPVLLLLDGARALLHRTPAVLVRLWLMAWIFLSAEVLGLLLLAVAALRSTGDPQRLLRETARVQQWWTGLLLRSAARVFRLRFQIEGDACVRPGPVLVFAQHASVVDTLLPAVFVTARHGLLLRYVLKRELLLDPCLDIAGNRLRNHFVGRDGVDSVAEIAAVRGLAQGLGPDEGVLIYPEGTRCTPQRQARARSILEQRDPEMFALARGLRHVLPPRLGGPMALLEQPLDVVFLAHHGLEGVTGVREALAGRLVGSTVRLRLWRVSRRDIPAEPAERKRWLLGQWQLLDDWLHSQKEERP